MVTSTISIGTAPNLNGCGRITDTPEYSRCCPVSSLVVGGGVLLELPTAREREYGYNLQSPRLTDLLSNPVYVAHSDWNPGLPVQSPVIGAFCSFSGWAEPCSSTTIKAIVLAPIWMPVAVLIVVAVGAIAVVRVVAVRPIVRVVIRAAIAVVGTNYSGLRAKTLACLT